ncbi:MAG: hypothetical protein WBD00_01775 [Candidatus Omnitrophota bacterium]
MKPRKNYRTRPKKTGAKKNQRILSQKRRLLAAGIPEEKFRRMTIVDIRDLVKEVAKKKGTKKTAKPAAKKTVKKAAKPAAKKTVAKKPAKKK